MRNQSRGEVRRQENELAAAVEEGREGASRAYAEFLTKDGRMDQALAWWERAAGEGDDDAVRTLGICHKDRGEFAEAERWYRVGADRDGGCAFGLATLLKEAGDLDGAEEWYARGAELGSVECLTNGAVLHAARHGEWDEAIARLVEAQGRGDRVAARSHGLVTSIREDLARWRDDLAAAEAAGDAEAAHEALAELLDEDHKGMYDAYPSTVAEAEALFARAAAVGSRQALVDQAIFVARDPARWEEARTLAERAHELGYSGGAYVLGVWHEERGELREAERWYRTAAESEGGHIWACFNLGVLCKRQRRLDEAERWYRATGVSEDDHDAFDDEQEMVVRQLRGLEELREDPKKMPDPELEARLPELRAEAEEGGPEERYDYADALDRLYRLPEAADWYRASGTPLALRDLVLMLEGLGGAKGEHLLPYLEEAVEAGDADAAYEIGTIHNEKAKKAGRAGSDGKKDKRAAQLWFLRAAEMGHGGAGWQLGWLSEERGGDPQYAERWYVHAARTGLPRPAYLAGCSMVRYGRYEEAEPWLTMAWEADIPEASYELGRALRALGRAEEAEEWLRRAVGRYGDFGRERYGLSRLDPRPELAGLLVEQERDEDAAPVVEEILREYPKHLAGNRYAGQLARRRGDLEAAERHFAMIEDRDSDGSTGMSLREIRALLREVTS
ncbi:tetratricopeptide repeat protein [Streptomyces sp. NPDC048172]|uniref:tetratricopeptide repeat protein n=1 Tax=Streptomyces sp. NPDC048172 TaxID=3365505 RepID=UPI003713356E